MLARIFHVLDDITLIKRSLNYSRQAHVSVQLSPIIILEFYTAFLDLEIYNF